MEMEQRIRERAQQIWEDEGRPEGRADIHWQQATDIVEAEAKRKPKKRKR